MRKFLTIVLVIVGLATFAACSIPNMDGDSSSPVSETLQTSENSSEELQESSSSTEEGQESEDSSDEQQDSQSSQDKNQVVEPIVGGGTFDVGDNYNG